MAILSQIAAGSFVADNTPKLLPFAGQPDIVRLYYQGDSSGDIWVGATGTKEAFWNRNMPNGSAMLTVGVGSNDQKSFITALVGTGVSYYDPEFGQLGVARNITGIAFATGVVTTAANHGYVTGDVVLITGTTGMLQIAGMYFQVTVLSPTTFTLNGLNTVPFGANATAGVARKVLYPGIWQPQSCLITNITQAADAVITTSVNHGYVAGQLIYLAVAPQFGMSEASGKITKIKSVTANTMTVELDTSGFTAFAFPGSAQGPFDFPNLSNYGADSSLVLNAYRNDAVAGVYLGSAVCGTSGLVHYEIIQADSFATV